MPFPNVFNKYSIKLSEQERMCSPLVTCLSKGIPGDLSPFDPVSFTPTFSPPCMQPFSIKLTTSDCNH